MSKKKYNRVTKPVRVKAFFSKMKKDERGVITDTPLYNIYGPSYLMR